MMDGRIGAIRDAGGQRTSQYVDTCLQPITHPASGPFRDAVGSATSLGKSDKAITRWTRTSSDEALREVGMDIAEECGHCRGEACAALPRRHSPRAPQFRIPTFA
jgi:porphobilinogen synthase